MPPSVSKSIRKGPSSSVAVTPTKKALIAKILKANQPASNNFTAKDFKKVIEVEYVADPGAGVVDCSSNTFNNHIKIIRELINGGSKLTLFFRNLINSFYRLGL